MVQGHRQLFEKAKIKQPSEWLYLVGQEMVVEFCHASCEEEVSKEVDILGSELILILQVNIDEVVLTNQPDREKTKRSLLGNT